MSYVWFNSVLEALGKRINFESVSNLYGNAFCKEPDNIVRMANPLAKFEKVSNASAAIMSFAGQIQVVEGSGISKEEQNKVLSDKLGDISWASDLF